MQIPMSLNVIYQQISVGDLSLKLALRPGQWSIRSSSFHAPIQWTGFDLLPLVQSSEGDPSRGIQPGLPCAKATLVCRFHAHSPLGPPHIAPAFRLAPFSRLKQDHPPQQHRRLLAVLSPVCFDYVLCPLSLPLPSYPQRNSSVVTIPFPTHF